MKRIKYLLLIITAFLFPAVVNASGGVEVINVSEQSKDGDVAVVADPTFSGLKINYNLAFNEVGDSITYKATIKNNEKEDYKIENSKQLSESGYIEYTFNYLDNSNIIKANSTKDISVTIKYANEVPDSALVSGEYSEANNMKIVLTNNGKVVNPKTSTAYIIIITIMVIALLGLSIFLYKKNKKVGSLVLVVSLLLPMTAYALKTITVEVNTNIVIERNPKFCVIAPERQVLENNGDGSTPWNKVVRASQEQTKNYEFVKGMTFNNWFNSEYFDSNINNSYAPTIFASYDTIKCYERVQSEYTTISSEEEYNNLVRGLNNCDSEYGVVEDINTLPIKSRAEGCYLYDARYPRQ